MEIDDYIFNDFQQKIIMKQNITLENSQAQLDVEEFNEIH